MEKLTIYSQQKSYQIQAAVAPLYRTYYTARQAKTFKIWVLKKGRFKKTIEK